MSKSSYVVNNCYKNNRSVSVEQFNLLSKAIDVFVSPEYNLEGCLKNLLTSIKYYCNFDFVGYWKYNQYEESFSLHVSSEKLSNTALAKNEILARTLPWTLKDYKKHEYLILKSTDISLQLSKNSIKIVHEKDAHFFAVIPLIINDKLFGMLTFSNYRSSNTIPDTIKNELENFSKLLSNAIHKKLLIEEQQKYFNLLNIVSSWKLLLIKPMPIFLQNMQQINWLYKYGVISTTSKELANISGYLNEKAFNEAAVSLNEFMPRNSKSSIKFLLNIIKNNHSASNIEFSKIDKNKNVFHYRVNLESRILSCEVISLTFKAVLYKSNIFDRNINHFQPADLTVKENLDTLTKRESELLLYVISGSPNKLIADELGISEKTVKAHRGKIMKKLKVCCFAELVRACDHLGLSPKYTSYYSYSDRVA